MAAHPLEELRLRIHQLNEEDMPLDAFERLVLVPDSGGYHVEFYGNGFSEAYVDLCETLSQPSVASQLLSVHFHGPDEGANGTRNWDLEPLLETGISFPRLASFSVARNQPGDHNYSIIGSGYDEEGVVARLAEKCAALETLVVPSAPSREFFEVNLPKLRMLAVDAGYETQDFIRNFSSHAKFPALRFLEWGDFPEAPFLGDLVPTPFEDYKTLFSSPIFQQLNLLLLRRPRLSQEQLQALRALRPERNLQFKVVHFSSQYL